MPKIETSVGMKKGMEVSGKFYFDFIGPNVTVVNQFIQPNIHFFMLQMYLFSITFIPKHTAEYQKKILYFCRTAGTDKNFLRPNSDKSKGISIWTGGEGVGAGISSAWHIYG